MNDPRSAREALIAELLADVDGLMQRVESLGPELDASLERFRATTQAITDAAQTSAVTHIVRRTNEEAKRAIGEQTTVLAAAARVAFEREAAAQGKKLAEKIEPEQKTRQPQPRWPSWWTHALTAILASAVTAAVFLLIPGAVR